MNGDVHVEAYAGYKGEETPRAFTHEGTTRRVDTVLSRWYTETHSYFKVLADDGFRYVLRYDLDALRWELVMRESEPKTEPDR